MEGCHLERYEGIGTFQQLLTEREREREREREKSERKMLISYDNRKLWFVKANRCFINQLAGKQVSLNM